jgi:hypothetical protein
MRVLEMTNSLFRQRRRVIEMLYEARDIIGKPLPRIKVRIVDFQKEGHVLGRCFIDRDYITISKELADWSDTLLRHVVWHELGHAYFSAKHNDKCPLMAPSVTTGAPREELAKALKKLSKGGRYDSANVHTAG